MNASAPAAGGVSTEAPLARHTLVWIDPAQRWRVLASIDDATIRTALRRWFAADWPLVVRRPDHGATVQRVALGLPLPPGEGKRRFGLEVQQDCIGRTSPPLRLAEAAPRLPARWAQALRELAGEAPRCGVDLRVYGSVAWQALTGLDYLHATSDVDLLWQPHDLDQLDRVLAMIERWQSRHGLRADGEFVLPCGSAVAWREWRASRADDRVLVKRIGALSLVPRARIAAQYPAARGLAR